MTKIFGDERQRIWELHDLGFSQEDIARKMQISSMTVRRVLKAGGWKSRSYPRLSEEQAAEARRLRRESGWTYKALQVKYNVSFSTIKKAVE